MLLERNEGVSTTDCWIEEIKSLIEAFESISSNNVVDKIAKNAITNSLNCDWLSNFPEWIVNQV